MPEVEWLDWPMSECYGEGWGDLIAREAYAHPAKYARGLIFKIVRFGLERGYWKAGDIVADCFGGVALGGIACAYSGLRWVGCELEPRFVTLGNQNIDLHRKELGILGCPTPVLVQGDSRNFAAIAGEVAACVTSPPYAETPLNPGEKSRPEVKIARLVAEGNLKDAETIRQHGMGPASNFRQTDYGTSEGQLGQLPVGDIGAVITSPPYAESVKGDFGETETAEESRAKRKTPGGSLGQSARHGGYGVGEGQVGALKCGQVEAVLTSPPWVGVGTATSKEANNRQVITTGTPTHRPDAEIGTTDYAESRMELHDGPPYMSPEWMEHRKREALKQNISRLPSEAKDDGYPTYWSECAKIYRQCYLAIRPNGVLVCVVKNYVQKGKIVPLTDQTCALLTHLGFRVETRIRCWLTNEAEAPGLFGDTHKDGTSRKSFFRRLHERKRPDLKIDFEEVIVARREVAP